MNKPHPEVRWSLAGWGAAVDRVAVHAMRKDPRLTKRQVRAIVDAMWAELWRMVCLKGRFEVPTYGVFRIGRSKARRIANPHTNEPMTLPASWSLRFRPAAARKGNGHGPV